MNTIQIPDYSDYLSKEYIIFEDVKNNTDFDTPLLKGVRFIIKEIISNSVIIKISNTPEELDSLGMFDDYFNKRINDCKEEIKIYKKICKMWTDDKDKFIIDPDNFWNKEDSNGSCINTCYYGIPADHPDKYGDAKAYYDSKKKYINSDSIMTFFYKRTDGKTNIHSYQAGKNEFYSKNTYEFMMKAEEENLKKLIQRPDIDKKYIANYILRPKTVKIKSLNKIKFDFYSKK